MSTSRTSCCCDIANSAPPGCMSWISTVRRTACWRIAAVIVALASQKAVKLQVGGGVRSAAVIDELLRNGVERVVVGSAAVERPAEVAGWFKRLGRERICLASICGSTADGVPRVRTRGWTEGIALTFVGGHRAGSLPEWSSTCLCTDIERDGALPGPI